MEDKKIIGWLEGYAAGTLTGEEEVAFFRWYSVTGLEEFQQYLQQSALLPGQVSSYPAIPEDFRARLEKDIRNYETESMPESPVIPIFRRYRLGWAAAVLVLIGVGGFFFVHNRQTTSGIAINNSKGSSNDVAPGTTKAVLTLADGSRITLDSARTGELAVQGKTSVLHKNGAISYKGINDPEERGESNKLLYNTLTTSRGQQSPPLTLSDGTKVWLNALSSIRFPVSFTGNTRQVEITGEAFFEIAKNPALPFHVKTKDMEVEVLGTSFNINAYSDEPDSRTTLLEGKVRVLATGENSGSSSFRQTERGLVLEPGQQARVQGSANLVKNPDLDQVLAWKTGLFDFSHADLQTVLRQLSRWYDIDIKFEGQVPARSFHGKITRDLNLSQVIHLLQDLDVKFRIEGKILIVTP